jgi:response regulator NasT
MDEKLKILLAEDEYLVLMGLKADLEELGHEVIAEATDGESAVKLAIEKFPDMIIMDINMPNIDGIDAIKEINKKIVVPSIIVTGYSDKDLVEKATEAGVFSYLVKPIGVNELGPAINIAMNRFGEFKKLEAELSDAKEALEARKDIERAKGILMDTFDLKEKEAMKRLQKKSQDKNMRLVSVAQETIKAKEFLD